jgi:hypothetical protein
MPRYVPQHARTEPLPAMGWLNPGRSRDDSDLIIRLGEAQALERFGRCTDRDPYMQGCRHSFFADLLRVADDDQRGDKRLGHMLAGESTLSADPLDDLPAPADRNDDLERVHRRLGTVAAEKRDLTSANAGDVLRPSLPGYLGTIWGQAARSTGTLAAALGTRDLEAGMVDTVAGVPTVSLPRLATGSAVAIQASQNAGVQETDPTTASNSSPVATVSGQVDMSRQVFEFSKPGLDEVITDDLSRALAANVDGEIINGTAASGRTRGLLTWAGIITVTGSVTNAQTFLNSIWQAYSQLAGSSGFGAADTDGYITVLHPRRAAWLAAGVSGTLPPGQPLVPGRLVSTAGIRTDLGGGTEDVALVIEASQIVVLARQPSVRVYDDATSGTMTVRSQAVEYVAVLAKNASAIARVTGLTAPAGF